MSKPQLCLFPLLGNVKGNRGAVPLGLVFDKVDGPVHYAPHHPVAWNELDNPLRADMVRLITVGKLIANLVVSAFDAWFTRPPSAHVINCGKDLFWGLIDSDRRCVILRFHVPLLLNKCRYSTAERFCSLVSAL